MDKYGNKSKVIFYGIIMLLIVGSIVGYHKFKQYNDEKNIQEQKKNQIRTVEDISGKKIGVQIGTTGDIYASDYQKEKKGTVIERYNKGTDAISALKLGKIDCVIIDEQPSKAFVEKNHDIKILKEEFANEDYAFCLAKSKDALKIKINDALEKLKADGTLQKIISGYIGNEKGKYSYQTKKIKRQGSIVIGTNAEFPPYEYFDNGKIVGIDMDIMRAVSDQIGVNLKIQNMDFDSIITAVTSGKVDVGVSAMTVTKDRLKSVDFSNSYTNAKQVIVVKDFNAVKAKTSFKESFYNNFIKEGRYKYLLNGFGNTLIITLFAIIIGIIGGLLIAIIRTTHDNNGGLPLLNLICKLYLIVMRGTPAVVQLMILYYVILTSVQNKVLVAVIGFGLNSAAYVAEVIRSGIMSVDSGQFEAGRSLGMNYRQTMTAIIIPQAFKNVLPALGNEFIVLIKETSISGYIGLMDLTKGGDVIRSITYEAYMPLYAVAIMYLFTVMLLTAGVSRLEKKLRGHEIK